MRTHILQARGLPAKKTVAIAVAAALIGAAAVSQLSAPAVATTIAGETGAATASNGLPGSFADVVEKVRPAVVNISTSGSMDAAQHMPDPEFRFPPGSQFDEFFKRFFDERMPSPERSRPKLEALGSGFIIDPAGYVVTNRHVVDAAEEITVILQDGTRLEANLVGADAKTDLALLRVDAAQPLPYVDFGDSDSARVGDWVIAIGNPFGLGGSTTTGIISARGRDINAGPLDDFLQIDAPINRGNSGGPLFDTQGKVIGVNTAIFSPNGGNVGIGFAIPAAMASDVVAEIREKGYVERGWLGVRIQPVTDEIAESLGMGATSGALVADVLTGSPAEAAGLRAGDVITGYDGEAVGRVRDLPRMVAATDPGTEVAMEVYRDGDKRSLGVTVGNSDDERRVVADARDEPQGRRGELGLALAELTPQARHSHGIGADTTGVLITDVGAGSPAAAKGLRAGDVIRMVNQTPVAHPGEVADEVARAKHEKRKAVLMLIEREGRDRFVALSFA